MTDVACNGPMDASAGPPREARWRTAACFALMIVAIQVTLGPKIQLSQWEVSADRNAGVAEGEAWLHGRLDIPAGMHDTAAFGGKHYNVFPPMMDVLTVALAPLHHYLLGRTDIWLPWPYVLLVFAPLPLLGFVVFRRETRDSAWAALLTVAWLGGTAVLPNLRFARLGQLGQINHLISQVGLLLIALDMLGKQRVWPALIGLLIAVWSRQMTVLYAIPLGIVAWQRRRLALFAAGLVVVMVPLLTLNYLKFGNVLETGYQFIYAGRDASDAMAARCRAHGVFSPHFVADNLYYMHAALPRIDVGPSGITIAGDAMGASIWLTTPLLVLVLMSVRYWWRDRARRLLMIGTLLVMAGLMFYHSPGFQQDGYNRFALDFIPIWLVVVAPWTGGGWRSALGGEPLPYGRGTEKHGETAGVQSGGWRMWFTLACVAWSLLYFQMIVPNL